ALLDAAVLKVDADNAGEAGVPLRLVVAHVVVAGIGYLAPAPDPVGSIRLVAAVIPEATAAAAALPVEVLPQGVLRVPGDVPAHRVLVVDRHEGVTAEGRRLAWDHRVEGHGEDVAAPPVVAFLDRRPAGAANHAGIGQEGLIGQRRVRPAAEEEFSNSGRVQPF